MCFQISGLYEDIVPNQMKPVELAASTTMLDA